METFEPAGPQQNRPPNVQLLGIDGREDHETLREFAVSTLRVTGLPVHVFNRVPDLVSRVSEIQGPAGVVIYDPDNFYTDQDIERVLRQARSLQLSVVVLRKSPIVAPENGLWYGELTQ